MGQLKGAVCPRWIRVWQHSQGLDEPGPYMQGRMSGWIPASAGMTREGSA